MIENNNETKLILNNNGLKIAPQFSLDTLYNTRLYHGTTKTSDIYSYKKSINYVPLHLLTIPVTHDTFYISPTGTSFDRYIISDDIECKKLIYNLVKYFPSFMRYSILNYDLLSLRNIKSVLTHALRSFISSRKNILTQDVEFFTYDMYSRYRGRENVILNSRDRISHTTGKIQSGAKSFKYTTNYYFCSKCFEEDELNLPKPLYSLMVKKEYVEYVLYCIFLNIKINPEVLELWIDESMDNPSKEEPIRLKFNSLIRKPLLKDGVKVVIHEDLQKAMMNKPVIKSFKSIAEQKKFIQEKFNLTVEELRLREGIILDDNKLDATIEKLIELPF